jgi:cytoskeletal protein CcmA (bactofilin family)
VANNDGSTVIGESILIQGSLSGDEDLTVRGRVEGTLTLTRTLAVEPTGVVRAEVQVKNCVISGVVVGNVTATESVQITSEGRMMGDIAAPRVIIHDGATFRGRIDMGEVDVGEAGLPRAVAAQPSRRALPRAEGQAASEPARRRPAPASVGAAPR